MFFKGGTPVKAYGKRKNENERKVRKRSIE